MAAAEQLITANLDIWSSAIKIKSAAGRGKSNKLELYGIKKLRELIMELAVRGVLVPQDPSDEPAIKLLKKIAAEKARLVKEGKIKKPKALPPIEDDEKRLALPNGWEWARFGNVYWLEYGDNLPQAKRSGTGEYSVYGSNGVVGTHDDFCVESPCIVVGRKGSAGALNLCLEECCWVTDVAYSLVPPECLSIEFVFRQLHTLQLDSLGKGIKPGLSRKEAYELPIVLPPFAEQERIVVKVDELMALCDQLEQQQESSINAHQTLVQTLLNALTTASERDGFTVAWARISEHFDTLFTTEWSIDQLKQTILQLAVMGKLVPQDPNDGPATELLKKMAAEKVKLVKDSKIKKQKTLPPIAEDEKPYQFPDGWAYCRLGDAIRVINGRAYKKHEMLTEGTPLLRVGNLFTSKEWYYSDLELEPDKYIDTGDLIFAWSASFGPFIWDGGRAIYHYHIWKLDFYDSDSLYKKYVLNFLQAITESIKASGHGIAMVHMTKDRMEKLVMPVPPIAEQHRLVAKLDELIALCDTLKIRIKTAQTMQLRLADAIANSGMG